MKQTSTPKAIAFKKKRPQAKELVSYPEFKPNPQSSTEMLELMLQILNYQKEIFYQAKRNNRSKLIT